MQRNPYWQWFVSGIHGWFSSTYSFGRQAATYGVIYLWWESNIWLYLPHEIVISLEHWSIWFILKNTKNAHQLLLSHIVSVWSFIALLWIQTYISPPVHIVRPTCPFLMSCALLNVIIFTIHPFFYSTPDGKVYSTCNMPGLINVLWMSWTCTTTVHIHSFIHSFRSCCNLSELSIKSLLSHSLPPLYSCHQTITLVLHPFSSLLPPPSKTLVFPLMKPKVSSSKAPETT